MPAPRRLAFVLAAAAAAVAIAASGTRTRAADDEPDGGASPGDLRTVT
jgi:hypothetical protein